MSFLPLVPRIRDLDVGRGRPANPLEAWSKGYILKQGWREDYSRFLDRAVEGCLLRKVGNGYQFIHPLLRDYFAMRPFSPDELS